MSVHSHLFSPIRIKGLELKNRISMAPLYLGYANADGTVSSLMLDHYREMAASGVSLVVGEYTAVHETGLGSPFSLRTDDNRFLPGLTQLAQTIQSEGALAFLQINHVGRYAYNPNPLAPSPVETFGKIATEMTLDDIERVVDAFAKAAGRVKAAGFDGVEIHGGMSYLIVQFLSPMTNLRSDEYGGSLNNRMRFALRVVDAVLAEVGRDYPVGYRFQADERVENGLHVEETTQLARELEARDLAYLSVMAESYNAFNNPEFIDKAKQEGYMVPFAGAIKEAVPGMPVITAGRIQSPRTAEQIIGDGKADLIGLARVLLADPLWPRKAGGEITAPIVACQAACSLCMNRVMSFKPAYCSQWTKARRSAFLAAIGEDEEPEL